MNIDNFIAHSGLKEMPNKREKIIFFAAIFLFSIVFLRTCWYPSHNAISVLKGERTEALYTVESLQNAMKADAPKGSVWNGTPQTLELYNRWAAQVAGMGADTALMNELNSQALLKAAQLRSLSFKDVTREEGVLKRGFEAQLYGDFAPVVECLDRIYDIPLLMIIEGMTLTNANQTEGEVNLNLEGVVYGWK